MKRLEKVSTISERLLEVMAATGKKQIDLVRETGLDKSEISRYLSGKYEPKPANLSLLADSLNVSEAWLFGYDVPKNRVIEKNRADGPNIVATVSARMNEALIATGKKQIELAAETGLSHSTISRYLSGQIEPRHEAMIAMAKVLNVSEMWLWGYNVPRQKKNDADSDVVSRLRNDADFFEVVSLLAELPPEQYASIKQLISALRNK